MKTASEYRQYATECRQLAGKEGVGEARTYLLEMAELWSQLAQESAPGSSELSGDGSDLNFSANDSRAQAKEPSP